MSNKEIKEIYGNFASDEPIMLIKYQNNRIVALNYYSGEIVFDYGEKDISLLNFIKSSINSSSISTNNRSYQTSNELINQINNADNINVVNSIKGNNNNIIDDNGNKDSSNVSNTLIKNDLVISYNASSNIYDVYSVGDILDIQNDNVLSVSSKIDSNVFLNHYFENSNYINELFRNNRTVIYGFIILLIIVNLVLLVFKYKKGGKHV